MLHLRLPGDALQGLVVIEGLIGVGKTSLCRILERQHAARLVLEPVDDNPFLARFYADPEHFALPTQLFYMAARYVQQQTIRQQDLFAPLIVSDYLFEKDRIFAEMTLRDHELDLYRKLVGLLPDPLPRPDLVVFMDADTDVIYDRIRRRGLGFEQKIPRNYLEGLRERYLELWSTWDRCPLLSLRTDQLNYVDSPEDRAWILNTIQEALQGKLPGSAGTLFTPRA